MNFKDWLTKQEAFSLFGTGPESSVGVREKELSQGRNGESPEGGMAVMQAKLPRWKRSMPIKKDYPARA